MSFILVVFALYLNMDIKSFEKESHILLMFNLKLKELSFIFSLTMTKETIGVSEFARREEGI